ncbi:hypothetical protein ACFL6G_04275 [candidate division KSB1 bacterium]
MKNVKIVYRTIEEIVKDFQETIYSAAFIGSNYKANVQKTYKYSDIDCLIILKSMDKYNDLVSEIKERINNEKIIAINGWGVINQNFLKKEVVHLLIDPIWYFKERRFLFRNSVSTFPAFYGKSLTDFCEKKEILKDEYLFWAPQRMLNKLRNNDWDFQTWKYINKELSFETRENIYSDELGFISYACVHCIINTLRYLKKYQEFTPYQKIIYLWEEAKAPNISYVKTLLDYKLNPNSFIQSKNNILDINNASEFLTDLYNWIKRMN